MKKIEFHCSFCGRQCIEVTEWNEGAGRIVWKCPMRREWFVFLPHYESHLTRYVGVAEPKFDMVTGERHAKKS